MFRALTELFAAAATMFRAINNLAEAGENVSQWAKDETAFFNDKATMERTNKLVLLNATNAQRIKELGIEKEVIALSAPDDSKPASKAKKAVAA